MLDAWLDLVLGSSCAVCRRPGRVLCVPCAGQLPRSAYPAWPTPPPPGLALPAATGEYGGALKLLVNAHKERQRFALARPLGVLLAQASTVVAEAADPAPGPWFLVPVPSRGTVVRLRGHDPVLRMTRAAAGVLRRRGLEVRVARLLVSSAVTRDQAGLHAADRARNLEGSMRCRASAAVRLRSACPGARLVVTDDVVTTGSTAREAQRALEAAGLDVAGIAAVAATRKRVTSVTPAARAAGSLPLSHPDD